MHYMGEYSFFTWQLFRNYVRVKSDQAGWAPCQTAVVDAMALHGPYHDSSTVDCHWGARRSLGLTQDPIDIHLADIVGIRRMIPRDGVGLLVPRRQPRSGRPVADVCSVDRQGVDVYSSDRQGAGGYFAGLQVVRSDCRNIPVEHFVDNYCQFENTHSGRKPTYVRSHAGVEEIQNSRI